MASEAGKPTQITEPHLFLVEGKEDKLFFDAFFAKLSIRHMQFIDVGGKPNFPAMIQTVQLLPGFQDTVVSLSLIRDADKSAHSAFDSACGALKRAGLSVPRKPCDPAGKTPVVRVFILPSSDSPGILEDLCLQALAGDKAMRCVKQYFACLKKSGVTDSRESSKARIHAWLASREKPDLRLGEAAAAGYIPWKKKAFKELAAFLKTVAATNRS